MKTVIGVTHVSIETFCKKLVNEEFAKQPLFVREKIYNDGRNRYQNVKRKKQNYVTVSISI